MTVSPLLFYPHKIPVLLCREESPFCCKPQCRSIIACGNENWAITTAVCYNAFTIPFPSRISCSIVIQWSQSSANHNNNPTEPLQLLHIMPHSRSFSYQKFPVLLCSEESLFCWPRWQLVTAWGNGKLSHYKCCILPHSMNNLQPKKFPWAYM